MWPYNQGFRAGLDDEDSRSCPYETTPNINEWLDGWYDGQAERERRK